MNNGFMAKAGAGLGTGLAIAGQMGLHSQLQGDLQRQHGEILAQLEETKQGYENQRNAATIAGQKDIHAANNATQLQVADKQAASHLAGIGMMASVKDNKPSLVPKGAVAIGADGSVLYDNSDGDKDELMPVPEGTTIIDKKTRQPVFNNPKTDEGLSKNTKDLDHRVTLYQGMVKDHLGVGFLEKLNDTERKEFDQLLTNGADQVRKGTDPEKAFRATLDAFQRKQAISGGKTESGGNSKVESLRNRLGY